MLSIPDMALLGAAALLLFGPEQLPRVARRAGNVMREIQNTSSSFIRELERAADIQDAPHPPHPSVYEPVTPYEPPAPDPAAYDVLHDAVHPEPVGEKLAEPREALRPDSRWLDPAAPVYGAKPLYGAEPMAGAQPAAGEPAAREPLHAAEAPPERDHSPHV